MRRSSRPERENVTCLVDGITCRPGGASSPHKVPGGHSPSGSQCAVVVGRRGKAAIFSRAWPGLLIDDWRPMLSPYLPPDPKYYWHRAGRW